jgi:acetoacetate decarboxylase
MRAAEIASRAFAMPLTSPSYPTGPHRFTGREYLILAYPTAEEALRRMVPAPLRPRGPEARFHFVRMPDSTGFGDYALAAQVVPVTLPGGEAAGYVHAMYVNSHAANSGGREIWGFPQKLARPSLAVERDTLVGRLEFGPVAVAQASMGFKHRSLPEEEALADLAAPGVLLKIMPHVDGSPRILELVRYRFGDIVFRGGWTGPAALALTPHALAPVAELPVLGPVTATHVVVDCTLELGEVIHDYLAGRAGR